MPLLKTKQAPHCPRCNATLDGYTDPTAREKTPQPGDFGVCADCKALLRYDDNMQMHPVTKGEVDACVKAGILDVKELYAAGVVIDSVHFARRGKRH